MSLTAEILHDGEKYFDSGSVKTVKKHQMVVVCHFCGYNETVMNRFGIDFAESRREDHLTETHLRDIELGRVSI